MEHLCTECFYLFCDEVIEGAEIKIVYRCSRPIRTQSKKRLRVAGVYHDVITTLIKSPNKKQEGVDTIVTPDWCEGFIPDKD